jgi:flagellar basal body-associated protein FliL
MDMNTPQPEAAKSSKSTGIIIGVVVVLLVVAVVFFLRTRNQKTMSTIIPQTAIPSVVTPTQVPAGYNLPK